MSLNLHQFDTTFNSFNISNCSSINSSVSVVSAKKINHHNPTGYHLQSTVKLCIISAVVQTTDDKSRKVKNFGLKGSLNCSNSVSHDGKFDAFVSQNCSVKILDVEDEEKIENHGSLPSDVSYCSSQAKKDSEIGDNVNGRNCGVKSLPVGGNGAPVRKWERNSPARNAKGSACLAHKGSGHGLEDGSNNKKRIRSETVVKKMNARCSMKCQQYTGRIHVLLEGLDSCSNLDEAFMPWKRNLNNREMSIILKEQLRWERALEIFEWFKKNCCNRVNAIHYNITFRVLGKSRRWYEVEKLWDEMGERKIQPVNSTYGTLIDVYRKNGDTGRAVKLLETMVSRGIEPDEVTMGIIVQMYKNMGDFGKAEAFFIKWLSGKCKNSKAIPILSLHTYNNLIDTYGKTGNLEEACRFFEQMISDGVIPTTVTFNIMIHMYGTHGQHEEVSSLIKQMKDLQCSPDTRTYNILIHLHSKHNSVATAAKYFREMREASLEPDIVTYRTLLYAFSLKHMVHEAEELVLEMNEKGFEIDEYTQSALTRMYVEAGMLESAWLWFERFHLKGNMTSQCYSANIDAFGEHGHIVEAENVFNFCQERHKLTVLEFNVMIKAYGISRNCDKACLLFDTMEQYGVLPDRCSYSTLIQTLASTGMPHVARKYVAKMQDAGLVDNCIPYCAVISSFAKLGKTEAALEFYEEMSSYNILPDVVLYGVLISIYADAGYIKEVTKCLNSMKSAGIPLNAIICSSLMKLYTSLGYLEEAEKTYRLLQSFDDNTYSSNCMIDLYSRLSMITEAEVIFEKLKRKNEATEFSYAMMLCMYKRNGMFTEAYQVAEKMKEVGILTDLLSYNNILSLYASDGRYKDAADTFEQMLVSAINPDDFTFKALGIILLKRGVLPEEIAELELSRQDDAQHGLQNWKKMLSTVIDTSK